MSSNIYQEDTNLPILMKMEKRLLLRIKVIIKFYFPQDLKLLKYISDPLIRNLYSISIKYKLIRHNKKLFKIKFQPSGRIHTNNQNKKLQSKSLFFRNQLLKKKSKRLCQKLFLKSKVRLVLS